MPPFMVSVILTFTSVYIKNVDYFTLGIEVALKRADIDINHEPCKKRHCMFPAKPLLERRAVCRDRAVSALTLQDLRATSVRFTLGL